MPTTRKSLKDAHYNVFALLGLQLPDLFLKEFKILAIGLVDGTHFTTSELVNVAILSDDEGHHLSE